LHGQHLTKLNEGAAYFLNRLAKTLGARKIRARQPAGKSRPSGKVMVQGMQDYVAENDEKDISKPLQA